MKHIACILCIGISSSENIKHIQNTISMELRKKKILRKKNTAVHLVGCGAQWIVNGLVTRSYVWNSFQSHLICSTVHTTYIISLHYPTNRQSTGFQFFDSIKSNQFQWIDLQSRSFRPQNLNKCFICEVNLFSVKRKVRCFRCVRWIENLEFGGNIRLWFFLYLLFEAVKFEGET